MNNDLEQEFSKNGFVVIKNFFDFSINEDICQEIERIHKNFENLKTSTPHLHKLGEWSIKSPHLVSSRIKEIIFSKELRNLCLRLVGENVDLFWSATAAKPKKNGKAFPWHQDTGYDRIPKSYVTVWMAFDFVDEENGCLWAIPGSHLEKLEEHEFKKSDDLNYAGVFIKGPYLRKDDGYPIRLSPGDIVCMHSRLVHSSQKNSSIRERRGLIAAYISANSYSSEHIRGIPEATEPFFRK